MVRVYFILLTLSVSLFACKKAIQTDEPDALVKVNDRILTRNEVESLIPKGTKVPTVFFWLKAI
jgi:hypothetical protein